MQSKVGVSEKISLPHALESTSKLCAIFGIIALPISTSLTDVFLVFAVITMLASGNLRQKVQWIINEPIALLFIGLFVFYCIGALYSIGSSHDISKALLKNTKLLYGALLLPLFVEARWRNLAIQSLLLICTIIMVLSYAKHFGFIQLSARYPDAAVFKSHIQTNFMMAIYSFFLLHHAITNKKWRWLWVTLFILASAKTLLFSQGRSGYIVYGVLMLLTGWQQWRWRGVLAMFVGLSILSATIYHSSHSFHSSIAKIGKSVDEYQQGRVKRSSAIRIQFYRHGLQLVKATPLFGSGTGSLGLRYQQIEKDPSLHTQNPHNEYLNISIQLGLLGLAYLLLFFFAIAKRSYKLAEPWQHYAQAILLAIAAGSMLNSWLMDTLQGHFFAVFLAVCFAKPLQLDKDPQLGTID